ncbi:MAG: tetratricopeptide repeat protein [Candidatus Poribacteria bacterium]|nr:tetratricopeptide repeat protein [Candidatus Poribacteria bacterium]
MDNYDLVIEFQPDCAEAYSNRGNVLKELGQLEAAADSYNQAIELQPDCAKAYTVTAAMH